MIYIKYTNRANPSSWFIYAHAKGDKEETHVLDSNGDTTPDTIVINLKKDRIFYKIKYLTEKEVDLLKLELL